MRFRCMPLPVLFLIAAIWALVCGVSFAVDAIPAAPAGSTGFSAFLTNSVFPIITAIFMAFVTRFLNQVGQKYHVESLTRRNNLLEQLAFQGITLAEEKAAQLAGSKAQLTGSDKLNMALQHILAVMPKVSESQAERVVHAMLAQIPGAGATGDKALTPGPSSSAIAIEGLQIEPGPAGPEGPRGPAGPMGPAGPSGASAEAA